MSSIELYKFQQDCVDKVGTTRFVSRLIADELDMGLGKTVELIACEIKLREQAGPGYRRKKTLIVAPLAVHDHWRNHLIKFDIQPSDIVVIDPKDRGQFIKALRGPSHYFILHWEALRLADIAPAIRRIMWFHIIADEVHRAKNRKSQQTRALKSLQTDFKSGGSGTPADDKPADLWSILNWLWPNHYRSFWKFTKTYCKEEETQVRGTTFKRWTEANPETVPLLLAEMRPWYVRRLKTEATPDLPEKIHTDLFVELTPKQRKAYDSMRKDMVSWVGQHEDEPLSAAAVIAQLVRLQQFALASAEIDYRWIITRKERAKAREQERKPIPERKLVVVLTDPSAKIDALQQLVEDNPTQQLVVFSQFRSAINLATRRLTASKVSVGRYTGDIVNKQERNLTVEAFQRGDIQVFAGTIAAGGEGITLTASSTVIFLDRHWSPTRNVQAEDRCHRIGQKNNVQVIDIIAKNTVDLGRRAAIARKWANIKLMLGDIVRLEDFES